MQVKQKQTRSLFSYYLTFMITFLALLVVVFGAYTRLTDAGLGCPDWPGCYGHWIVPKVSTISNQIIDSTKAWTEMLHRYLAGLLGIMIGVLAILSFHNRQFRGQPLILPIVLLMLVLAVLERPEFTGEAFAVEEVESVADSLVDRFWRCKRESPIMASPPKTKMIKAILGLIVNGAVGSMGWTGGDSSCPKS